MAFTQHTSKAKFFVPKTVGQKIIYEGWNFNSGNYLFTTDTK